MIMEYENQTYAILTWRSDINPDMYKFYGYELKYGQNNYRFNVTDKTKHKLVWVEKEGNIASVFVYRTVNVYGDSKVQKLPKSSMSKRGYGMPKKEYAKR